MNLHSLQKVVVKSKKRVGRGVGSGKGKHTTGRGNKGQKARSKVAIWFEGGQLPLIRRTPFVRGKQRLKSLSSKTIRINLDDLNKFPENSIVNKQSVIKFLNLPSSKAKSFGLKILNTGKLNKKLTVALPSSKQAARSIQDAGGKIIVQ